MTDTLTIAAWLMSLATAGLIRHEEDYLRHYRLLVLYTQMTDLTEWVIHNMNSKLMVEGLEPEAKIKHQKGEQNEARLLQNTPNPLRVLDPA